MTQRGDTVNRRVWAAATACACAAVGLAGTWAAPTAAADKPAAGREAPGKGVFVQSKVHAFHLELSAKEWERMQAVGGGMRFPGGPPSSAPPPKPADPPGEEPIERHKGGSFGFEFPWAHAELTAEGRTHKNIGLRYKGGGSYMMSIGKLRRNFKVALDHYDKDLRLHGLRTVNLNAGAMDPTRLREALAYEVYRSAGVPAPRTAFAEVTLTVPGKYDKELLGLYTVVEQVDKSFLRDRFQKDSGLLLKPEVRPAGPRSLFEYRGDNWEPYQVMLGAKGEPSKEEARRVIEFARLIHQADDERFRREIGSYLDIDKFLRFLAVTAFLANLDNAFAGHNYYVYLNPDTKRFVFIPWDLDLAFVGFPMMGSPEQQMDLSLTHPYGGANKLVDRLLAIKEVNEQYQKLLQALAATSFTKERLLKSIETVEQATKEPLAREKTAVEARKEGGGGFGFGGPGGGMFGRMPDLRTFVENRVRSVAVQLDGQSKGFVPAGFGFAPGPMLAGAVMRGADANADKKLSPDEAKTAAKRFFEECDKDKKDQVNEQMVADAINRLLQPPAGFGGPARPGGAPGGGGPRPPGFGPGRFLAGAILRAGDADKNNQLSSRELHSTVERWCTEWDKDKSGALEEKEIADGLNGLLGPPPGPRGPAPMPPAPPAELPRKDGGR